MKTFCRLIAVVIALLFARPLNAQTYCTPSFSGGVAPITYVKLNNFSRTSTALTSAAAYEDFSTDTILVGISENLTLVVQGNTDGNNTDIVTGYFDWNQNGVFTDPGESYAVGTINNSAGNNLLEAAITGLQAMVPYPGGFVRMRIVKQRGSQASSCSNSGIGQAEDYTLNVSALTCAGTPWAGYTTPDTFLCAGTPLALQINNYTVAGSITIQWESTTASGYWTPIAGATHDTYIFPGASVPTYFHAVLTCANAGGAGISNDITVNPTLAHATADTMLCTGDTISVIGTSCAGCMINLTGPNGFTSQSLNFSIPNATLNNDGWYRYMVTGPACTGHDSFYVHVVNCPDSVWPGDANDDNIANYLDVLHIAQYYGNQGYSRPFATMNYVGQSCPDWPLVSANNVNLKHADCNGDGTIDIADTTAVSLHYNLSHPKGVYTPQPKISGLPDIYLDVSAVNFYPGTTVNIPIVIGSNVTPLNAFLGIGAEIKITGMQMTQTPAIVPAVIPFTFLNFSKMISSSQVDWVCAKTSHVNTSSNGVFAYLSLYIPPGAAGDSIMLYMDNVVVVDAANNILTDYNILSSATVIKDPAGIPGISHFADNAVVVPNPSKESCILVTLDNRTDVTLTLSDVAGRIIANTDYTNITGTQRIDLPENLAPGLYYIRLTDKKTSANKLLKWIKE